MPHFAYTARDRTGQPVQSTVDAPSRKDALRLLASRGLNVSAVAESSAGGVVSAENAARKSAGARAGRAEAARAQRAAGIAAAAAAASSPEATSLPLAHGETAPRRAERLPFLESLLDLTTSGLSAGEAVRLLSVRIKEPRLRALAGGLWARLSEGAPLSRAMADFPAVFDSATINLIHAGEATGSLNDTLARLIAHLNEQRELRRQLLTAMAYPVFMVCVSFMVILFFLFFLLPRLQTLLRSLGGKLPPSTQILVGISNFALHYGIFVVLALLAGGISLWRWRATETGRKTSDRWLLGLPLLGPFSVSQTVLAFSQNLSVLLENGITAAEALRMTEKQIGNRVHRDAFDGAIDRVLEGEALSTALGRTGCFPDLVLDRLAVGENTGNVVPSLKNIAIAYQKQITNQLNVFTRVIASAVLMGVFVLVGFIAYSIVAAVFQVSASFKM